MKSHYKMKTPFLKIFSILLLTSSLPLFGQSISNLCFEAWGKTIQIRYDLSGKTTDLYEVDVYISQDNGSWEGPLRFVNGDVGENIKAGNEKHIIWDVLREKDKLTGNLKFKIEVTSMSVCKSFTITHSAGSVAPITKSVTYAVVETDLSGSKKCWITQNLGADRQATSATDATEASAGWYWQFNRKQGYKYEGTSRTPKTQWNSSISENSDWSGSNDPCALLLNGGWRLPSKTEWENADATAGWDNYNETYASILNLHAAGNLEYKIGVLLNRGSIGYYWSSSQHAAYNAWNIFLNSGNNHMNDYGKAYGFTVRCLRD